MLVKIKAKCHISNQPLLLPRFGLKNGAVICKLKFTDSCRYNLDGGDQLDWNKLAAGASWGFFPLIKQSQAHENSSRWGWRFNPIIYKIEVTPYFYSDGIRNYAETLGINPIELDLNRDYVLSIVPGEGNVKYSVADVSSSSPPFFIESFEQNVPSIKGWLLPAYFGGTKPAPHEIEYELTYL